MNENEKILDYVKMLMKEFNSIILLMLVAMGLTYMGHPIFTLLFIIALGLLAYKIIKINTFISKLEDILKEDIKISSKEDTLMKCHKKLSKTSDEDLGDKEKSTSHTQFKYIEEDEDIEKPIKDYFENDIEELTKDNKENLINEAKEHKLQQEEIKSAIVKGVNQVEEFIVNSIDKEIEELTEKNYVHNFDYLEENENENENIITNIINTTSTEILNKKVSIKEENVIKDNSTKEEPKDIDITKCIRKLPKGRKASEKAKSLALSYGYELKEGETFVAPKK